MQAQVNRIIIVKQITMAIYVVKVNQEKGTVTVADVQLASDDLTVLGEDATTSSGERPTKIGWFKLTEFFARKDKHLKKFRPGTEVTINACIQSIFKSLKSKFLFFFPQCKFICIICFIKVFKLR